MIPNGCPLRCGSLSQYTMTPNGCPLRCGSFSAHYTPVGNNGRLRSVLPTAITLHQGLWASSQHMSSSRPAAVIPT